MTTDEIVLFDTGRKTADGYPLFEASRKLEREHAYKQRPTYVRALEFFGCVFMLSLGIILNMYN